MKKKKYPLEHLDDARDARDNKWAEGLSNLSDSLVGSNEEESTLGSLQTILDNSALIYRTFQNNKKLDETKDVTITQVATDFNRYKDLNPFVDFTGEQNDANSLTWSKIQQLDPKDAKHNLQAKNVSTNKLNARRDEENTRYEEMRKVAGERQKKRMEDKLAEGSPLKKFELDKQRGVGTPVNELFKKPEDVNKVEQDKEIETEVKEEQKKEENKNDIIEKAPEITDSVKDIDGQIGDFVDPDKLKFKSLFGNMA